ncbi:arylamine N-acetyltransferase family protein [Streptomyces violaceusniger]|uniref:N-acetyltransferase n=1 Tax=Streptomyces violaceusniger (strain Tu 4113) TaxID=653045 RepID=G2NV86_STRV4|nr:arylamine N-acetyltransferase [Streptomyces violaceusniger]AEM85428.1 N-acetyltransferase [Streptomyces violaceusniger Tu 4113]
MFDATTYLQRIGAEGKSAPTLDTLRTLHKRHLMAVPYDNATAADRLPASRRLAGVPLDEVFDHVVTRGNGGVCYELNRLFHALLTELGFDARTVTAAVRLANGSFGPEDEHSFNLVVLDGRTYLVDVGFIGPSYLEPVRLSDEEQHQHGCSYRVARRGSHRVLDRRLKGGDWQPVYRFRPERADPAGWDLVRLDGLDDYAADSVLAGTTFRGRATDGGQMVLIGKRYLTVEDGVESIRVLVKADEYQSVVDSILAGA